MTTCVMSSGEKAPGPPGAAALLVVSADFLVPDGDEPGAVFIPAASARFNFTRDVFFLAAKKVQMMHFAEGGGLDMNQLLTFGSSVDAAERF